MGKIVAIIVVILTAWGALAQIVPGVFQIREHQRLKTYLWGPKTIWIAVLLGGMTVGVYIWNLEARLATTGTVSSVASTGDETGLLIVGWGPTQDGSGCSAVVNAAKLPMAFKDKFDIALVCGYANPTVDRLKDTRISVSSLFTPQEVLQITLPFSDAMTDFIAKDEQTTIEKLQPRPTKGTVLAVQHVVWFKAILVPKGMDRTNIQKLSDVLASGGKIANSEASVVIGHTVPAP
jgi:hypothetical protein